jgi:hypothetical protein
MIYVRMGDKHQVNTANRIKQTQIQQLVAGQPIEGLRRWTDAAVNQDAPPTNLNQCAVGANLICVAEKSKFHYQDELDVK